jgi:ribosome-binding protein aMBF1 (putative translation factor)
MDHQDWTSIALSFKKPPKVVNKGAPPKIIQDDIEDFKLKTINKELVKKIIQARVILKLNRKQLAIKCALKEQDIADIETGKMLASDGKINKVLRNLHI